MSWCFIYLCEELEVLLHEGEVTLFHQPGVEELVTRGPGVVRPVARQQEWQRDAARAIAWRGHGHYFFSRYNDPDRKLSMINEDKSQFILVDNFRPGISYRWPRTPCTASLAPWPGCWSPPACGCRSARCLSRTWSAFRLCPLLLCSHLSVQHQVGPWSAKIPPLSSHRHLGNQQAI